MVESLPYKVSGTESGCPWGKSASSKSRAASEKGHGGLFLSWSNGLTDRGWRGRQRGAVAVGEGKAGARMGVNSSEGGSAVAAKPGNTDGVGWQALSVADKPPREDNIVRGIAAEEARSRATSHADVSIYDHL